MESKEYTIMKDRQAKDNMMDIDMKDNSPMDVSPLWTNAMNIDSLEDNVGYYKQLPVDCILLILSYFYFPLHRYFHRDPIKLLYGYLTHRPFFLFPSIELEVIQSHKQDGTMIDPFSKPRFIPCNKSVETFRIVGNMFQIRSLRTSEINLFLSHGGVNLKKLILVYQPDINEEILPFLKNFCQKLEYLDLTVVNLRLKQMVQALLNASFLPELNTLKLKGNSREGNGPDDASKLPQSIECRSKFKHLELEDFSCIDDTVINSIISNNKHLESLNIARCAVSAQAFQSLPRNQILKSLIARDCALLDDSCITYIEQNNSITHLDISPIGITNNFEKLLFSEHNKVEYLEIRSLLSQFTSTTLSIEKLVQDLVFSRQNRFKRIDLSHNKGRVTSELLEHLLRNHKMSISRLDLAYCDLTSRICRTLFSFTLPSLHTLNIESNLCNDTIIEGLMQASQFMPSLTKLNFSRSKLTEQGAKLLSSHPTINNLVLSFNNLIGDKGANELFKSQKLQKLVLEGCALTDKIFDGIESNRLRKLKLVKNSITSNGVKKLLSCMPYLSQLDLTFNQLDDNSINDILNYGKSLTRLHIKRNQLTKKGNAILLEKASHITTLLVD
jgi:hypothetical protein